MLHTSKSHNSTSQSRHVRGSEYFELGKAYTRDHDALLRLHSNITSADDNALEFHVESPEACIMPFLFPTLQGMYDTSSSLIAYAKMRVQGFLTMFTLHSPYMLLLCLLARTHTLRTCTTQICLRKEVANYRRKNPNASDKEVYMNIIKQNISPQLTGSPGWHKKELHDLIAVVDMYGLPSLFVTLTSDEVSKSKMACIPKFRECHEFN